MYLEDLALPVTDGEVLARLEAAESDAVDDYHRHGHSLKPAEEDVRLEDDITECYYNI